MSINLKANPDGISGAIQINGVDAVPFNAGGVPTPSQFDNTMKVATTAFVQRALGNANGMNLYPTSATISANGIGGVHLPTAAGVTLTLPLAASCPNGSFIYIDANANGVTVARQGSDLLSLGVTGSVASIAVVGSDRLALYNVGTGWYAFSGDAALKGSSSFGSSLAASGYQKLPSGLIIQWGTVAATTAGATFTFPIAFPNNCFRAFATNLSGAMSTSVMSTGTPSLTIVTVWGSSNTGASVFAVGN